MFASAVFVKVGTKNEVINAIWIAIKLELAKLRYFLQEFNLENTFFSCLGALNQAAESVLLGHDLLARTEIAILLSPHMSRDRTLPLPTHFSYTARHRSINF